VDLLDVKVRVLSRPTPRLLLAEPDVINLEMGRVAKRLQHPLLALRQGVVILELVDREVVQVEGAACDHE
jgi:hypothetical protein